LSRSWSLPFENLSDEAVLTIGGMLETLDWDYEKLNQLTVIQWKFLGEYTSLKRELEEGKTTNSKLLKKKMGIK
jgi:hypothetical protein